MVVAGNLLLPFFSHYSFSPKGTSKTTTPQGLSNPITKAVTTTVDKYNKLAKNTPLPQIPSVAAIGLGGDAVPVTGSVQLVGDKRGNVGIMFTGGFKGKSDIEGGVSVVGTASYNMQSAADLSGSSTFVGGGGDFGEGLGVSGDYSYSYCTTSDGRRVSARSAAVGANVTFVPGEINTGTTYSKLYTFNAFDVIYDVFK